MTTDKSSVGAIEHLLSSAQEQTNQSQGIAQLSKAFELFSKETERLETAYASLRNEYLHVNRQLEDTNGALRRKILQLDNTTQYLHSILGHMRQGLVFVALDGEISTYNRAAEEILGMRADLVLGQSWWTYFSDDLCGFSLRQVLHEKLEPQVGTVRYGVSQELEITTSLVTDSLEGQTGLIILIRDVTELHRWQMLARRHDRLQELGEMAASVAHEIRNPLGGIRGFASLLARDLEDRPSLKAMSEQIADGADSINRLITNVLNYARPVQLVLEPGDLASLCQEAVELISMDPRLGQACTIKLDCSSDLRDVSVDRELIKSALCNLIVNAIQASPKGSEISLNVDQTSTESLIEVRDQGKGISESNIEKIFSPFFTTKHSGNGFGLSEVHKTIQAHGGTIDVVSKAGTGTKMTIRLPLVPTQGGTSR